MKAPLVSHSSEFVTSGHEMNFDTFDTTKLSIEPSYLAPDGSEIRLLPNVRGGGLSHCTLPAGAISQAVKHKTVDEIWYCLEGEGQVWRKLGEDDRTVEVHSGIALTIPVGTHFQFQANGSHSLRFLIATIPIWPGGGRGRSSG
jgi:mannose-6-phosphate isomerase-like protein (cupin superfamily)